MLAVAMLLLSQGPSGTVPLDDPAWVTAPANSVRLEEYRGRRAMRIVTGRASRPDIRFADGTIEFDLAATGGRAFAYLQFRMAGEEDCEEIYFRPHKNGLPDAIQYAPVHQGVSAWQFHHGPGGTAAARFDTDGWTHIRIEVSGQAAAVFVGDVTEPQLVVPRLVRPRAEGFIALRNFLPAGIDPRHASGFANLVVRPGVVSYDFSRVPPPARAAPGTVLKWDVAGTYAPDSGPIRSLPDSMLRAGRWRTLPTDPRGLLSFAEHLPIPEGFRRWATLARLRLTADRARTVRLAFGFSDEVTVFLNGRPIMSGNQRYYFDEPRQEGVIGFHQGTVYLPLRAGSNELILAIADVFGGWGVMGRLEDAAGVRLSP